MWDFNWGVFWAALVALVIYTAIKSVIKGAFGLYPSKMFSKVGEEVEMIRIVLLRIEAKLEDLIGRNSN